MKKIILLLTLSALLNACANTKNLNKQSGKYRIALSFDGNAHDPDDIIAAPLSLAIIADAGLLKQLVYVEYSSHIWGDEGKQPEEMRTSVNGAAERWNINKVLIYEVRIPAKLEAAKKRFAQEAYAAFKAGERLYYIMGGPMEVPYECISEINNLQINKNIKAAIKQNITLVSHSPWNEKAGCVDTLGTHDPHHCWDDMKLMGTKFVQIANQNNYNGDDDMNTAIAKWNWLKPLGAKYEWLFSRNPFTYKFDPSDAGMVYWVIAGRLGIADEYNPANLRENNSAELYASPAKIEHLFSNKKLH